jgi:hypothetical protein
MSLGDKAMFRFRADYAYGEEGSPERGTAPAIPSGASIEFELEVVDAVSLLAGTINKCSHFTVKSALDTAATDRKILQKQKLLEVTVWA